MNCSMGIFSGAIFALLSSGGVLLKTTYSLSRCRELAASGGLGAPEAMVEEFFSAIRVSQTCSFLTVLGVFVMTVCYIIRLSKQRGRISTSDK